MKKIIFDSQKKFNTILLTIILILSSLIHSSSAAPNKHTNILLILVDDLGWADLGCYGSNFHETPNLDRFAQSAMLFTNSYSANPVCSPTRAAILTGKDPVRVGVTDWIKGYDPPNRKLTALIDKDQLDLDEVTIAEVLLKNGYKTFFAGKWHLGRGNFLPQHQGFEINKGGRGSGSPPGGYYSPYKNDQLEDGPEGEYLTDRLTNETISFIEQNQDKPFFAMLSFYTVHTPIQGCDRYDEKFTKKAEQMPGVDRPASKQERDGLNKQIQDDPKYAAMMYAMDENVGRLLQKMEELNLDKNTVVIFTSDNGGLSTEGNNRHTPTSNLPLRAGKGWCYEGGIRIPTIIRAPGMTKAGSRCDEPIISMDYFPTILDLAGLTPLPSIQIDGKSLVPLLKEETEFDRDSLFWHYPHYHPHSRWTPGTAIRAGDWKLIEFYEEDKRELYNLKEDLGEKTDLTHKYPEKVKELVQKIQEYQKKIDAPIPAPNPKYREKKPFPKTIKAPKSEEYAGWTQTEIRDSRPGALKNLDNSIQIYAGGADTWGAVDQCRFVWKKVKGDFRFETTVTELWETHEKAKAGLMLRISLDPGSPMVLLAVLPDGKIEWIRRDQKGGECVAGAHLQTNFKDDKIILKRTNNKLILSYQNSKNKETDFQSWELDWISKAEHLGFCVLSHDNSQLTRAQFKNIKLTQVSHQKE